MRIFLYGMIIGIANLIPGVSGGTMAVILNIYDKIISSISNIRTNFKTSVKFLIPLGMGAGVGILLFAKVISLSLEAFPSATSLVFFGLIFGSIPLIRNKTKQYSAHYSGYICFSVTLAVLLIITYANVSDTEVIITTLSFASFLRLFSASFLSAGAMIVPGISGSFIMLLLGVYTSVLTAISDFNIIILLPVVIGCASGIIVCSKIIDILFKRFPYQTYMGILGLMLSSMVVIAPVFSFDLEFFIGCILGIISAKIARDFSNK